MDGKKKLQSIIKQVQTTTTKLGFKEKTPTPAQSSNDTKLDLHSAIEYNSYLINSYLKERNSRELPLYEKIISESKDSEERIFESISKEFFIQSSYSDDDVKDEDTIELQAKDELDSNNKEVITTDVDQILDVKTDETFNQSKILELCVLQHLPEFNPDVPNLFLNYIDLEKKKLTKQVTIVSKRLSDIILDKKVSLNDELNRVNSIDSNVQAAIQTCSSGRNSLSHSKRDFTSKSLAIIENYQQREAIIKIIKCLLNIKKIQSTIEHIQNLLEYEKNFPCAIRLYHETYHILEEMAPKYDCVQEMKTKLVEMLKLAEEQMDLVLAKLPDRFCWQTYQQLCQAYKQIDKSENSIHQLLMHFTNTIYDKAFSIVHGYVKLFTDLSNSSTSTPVKSRKGLNAIDSTFNNQSNDSDLKRKPFAELCQYLKPESFLSCLTDLCRAMWDIMQNYFQVLSFYRSNNFQLADLSEDDILFATTKLKQGVLRVWSDIQHKIRTIISSVKFVELTDSSAPFININDDINDSFEGHRVLHQDQLLFSFEEFIKILTVCEKMIEIGEEFCSFYDTGNSFDCTLQTTLYQQTRAYFQSYHQVSMAELRIFLENETWTRCPIESQNEFQLIANLQEFSFIKHRLLNLNQKNSNCDSDKKNKLVEKQLTKSSSSSYLLSPTTKSKQYFSIIKTNFEEFANSDCDNNLENYDVNNQTSPFDDIFILLTDTKTYDSHSSQSDDEINGGDFEVVRDIEHAFTEIVTTNTALNVLRLIGRYMHIMYLLRPISHDIIKALLELFDYYFFTVYRFFAIDPLNANWLTPFLTSMLYQSGNVSISVDLNESSAQPNPATTTSNSNNTPLLNHLSTELRSFIRRINETLIINEYSNLSINSHNKSSDSSPMLTSPNSSPKRVIKHPCPILPSYVAINSANNMYALGERIMATQSLIFISRQFYNLCPFLLDFLRKEEFLSESNKKSTEDGFKMLQFYHDQMCLNVESLLYQCLLAVSTKILPYDSIISSMCQIKWDLKEIPSIHSHYVDVFVEAIVKFNDQYRKLLTSCDLDFLLPEISKQVESTPQEQVVQNNHSTEEDVSPLSKLDLLSRRMNKLLWECIVRVSNRSFVEGFSAAKKCTNEGRALMQLDYQQFLSQMEKIMTPYFGGSILGNKLSGVASRSPNAVRAAKALLSNEKEFVEEFVKAYYLTDTIFIDWIRQRPDYTTKQVVSLINCLTHDNRKQRSLLLAAIDTSSIETSTN